MPTLLLKYIIVGSSAVGKTCILAMFTEQQVKLATIRALSLAFSS
jgi:GTPase SAR1 family protein